MENVLLSENEMEEKEIEFFKTRKKTKQSGFLHELRSTGKTRCEVKACMFAIETHPASSLMPLSFSDQNVAYLDAEKVLNNLVFRSFTPNDWFIPYGRKTKTTVNDFLKKQGITKDQRNITGVVSTESGEIVWVVGIRTDERFKVTSATRKVLKISYKPQK